MVTGAGGSPAVNFTRSLRAAPEKFQLIGVDCNKYYLQRAETDCKFLVPRASDKYYLPVLKDIIRQTKAEFIHAQNDIELGVLSEHREDLPTQSFLPSKQTVKICLDKFASYKIWSENQIPQPETMMIYNLKNLEEAFDKYRGRVWLRDTVGAAGKGALPTDDIKMAEAWLNLKNGWGHFTAAQMMSPKSITWQSLWQRGKLIVAQGRKRLYWEFADRAPSGITGLTGAGITFSDPQIDNLSERAIRAIDPNPHGIFSVDMVLDDAGSAYPTEINIGRFFTTHEFFTQAGLNMPYLYLKLGMGLAVELPTQPKNPLPENLVWVRGLDFLPKLTTAEEIEQPEKELAARLKKIML